MSDQPYHRAQDSHLPGALALRDPADAIRLPPPRRTKKAPHDTPGGCRDRASADLVAAAAMDTQNGRLRLEHSAAVWSQRATLIQRLDDSFEARQRAASAMWAEEEASGRRVRRGLPEDRP